MNPWRQRILDYIRDALRFLLWGAVFVDAFLLACLSVYIVWRFVFKFAAWADRVWFG